ncbi:hypothetical protein OH807_18150 [Kitasatospora sp. NBC_01560]|uniref:hypothetical protein n=1 Tax=Kitasatospora sp. NBC_01560 TaxID=2975965 RepID=UPI00386934E6
MSADRDLPDSQYEQDFSAALSRAGEAFHTETLPLVDSGWSYGRRLRRRRRASALAGAAALALIGVGGVAVADLSGGGGGGLGPAAGSAAPVSGQEFLGMLTGLLPAGHVVEVGEARGTESDTPQLRLTYDDGNGAVQYLFWITRAVPGLDADCATATAPDVCAESTTANGSRVRTYQAGTRSGEPAGSKTWSASLHSKNGYHLMLQEWNREPLEKGAPVTRTDPPLTVDRMTEVVSDKRWDRVFAAIPATGTAGKAATFPAPGGGATTLLPSDVAALLAEEAAKAGGTVVLPVPATPGPDRVPDPGATTLLPVPATPVPPGAGTAPAGPVSPSAGH